MSSLPDPATNGHLGLPAKLKDLHLIVWGLLFVGFILPFCIVVIANHQPPDADFAEFYSLGRILNEYSPHDLYNYELQKKICEQVHPRKGEYGPLPYPPFVGLFFRPATLLPYWAAYALWVAVCLVLYWAALRLAIKRFFPREPSTHSLLYALAFSYFPFIAYTAGNGQLAAVGLFAVSLALHEENQEHNFRSGAALSLCLYKPTILLLIVPMLLVTRRFKAFAGFVCGGLLLFLVTIAFEGFAVWQEFVRAIFSFGNSSVGVKNHSILPLAKYVDLTSFSSNIHGGRSGPGVALFAGASLVALIVLSRFWWKSRRRGPAYQALLWAATLTWTLLLNVYVPLYDSILVVSSILITAGLYRQLPGKSTQRCFTVIWILILICSWFSVPLSRSTGFQCMTLLFACLGAVQFVMLSKLTAEARAQSSRA